MPLPHRQARVAAAAVLALGAGLIAVPVAGAQPASLTVRSAELTVTVAADFPRVISYADNASGATLSGRAEAVTSVVIDGKAQQPKLDGVPVSDGRKVSYRLTFPQLPGVRLDASLSVDRRVTTFRIDAVRDTEASRVHTIEIPDHDLVSVRGTDPGAQVAAAKVDLSINRRGDTIYGVTPATPADAAPIGSYFTLVSTGKLAAALETNSVYDKPAGPTVNDNAHFWRQARKSGADTVVGVWSGQWTYRAAGAAAADTEPLPEVKIAVTPERNGDNVVDWQDAALSLREIAYAPKGGEKVADRVVQRIPFNIASMATNPFAKTLDETKRISLATDGLGQLAILKGYQSEGHDAAHPDYGGNYNTRAGGLADLKTLLDKGSVYNADFGVHVNATESYPEARSFSETLVDKNNEQWAWMDQSYRIDQRRDLISGDIQKRLRQLAEETGGKLDFLYWDVFRESGWTADRLAREVRALGWETGTEWSHRFVRDSLWTHWSADIDYGGADFKGVNSQIMRFVDNHRRDVYISNPLLGSAQIVEFEGWTGEVDYGAFSRNVFGNNLPVKFLQHFPIQRWGAEEIVLDKGVRVTGTSAADRKIFAGSAKVADGDAYLLPWNPAAPDKLYHYNAKGGQSTWQVPAPFTGAASLTVSKLTDTGRVSAGTVAVEGGQVRLTAEPNTAYVLESGSAVAVPDVRYGEGGPLRDPGFNYGDFRAWQVAGDPGAAKVERNARGQYEAVVSGHGNTVISQDLAGLAPGSYAASVDVEVEQGRTRPVFVGVNPRSGAPESTFVDRSTLVNTTASDEKLQTRFQRVRVFFDVRVGGAVTLSLRVAPGQGVVRFDNARVVAMKRPAAPGRVTSWDFEDVDAGWGPFYRGVLPIGDANTHLSELHAPFTQRGWNGKVIDDVISGKWSLKSYEYDHGISYRTTPATVRFLPGHRYRVSFDYENAMAGAYGWTLGVDGPAGTKEVGTTPFGKQTTAARHVQEFVAGACGDYWVGLKRLGPNGDQVEFALDDFAVEDLGKADSADACGSVDVASATQKLLPGKANTVTTTFRNGESGAATGVSMALTVPQGWQVAATGPAVFESVASGASVSTQWAVTPPADAATAVYDVVANTAYEVKDGPRAVTNVLRIETVPAPPTVDVWAGDHGWLSASNGWGPVERDRSNGESGAGDGGPITLNGVVHEKGLGTHAPSTVVYYLGGNCASFTAQVGVDDRQASRGSVQFTVLADGRQVAQSPVMRPDTATFSLAADIGGAQEVRLVVSDGGDGVGNDHADWGSARFLCG
ncbi:endo-alpha-N-acetylgalactosaminidase family protein [Actinokineospora xionganensis]|uniref:NPCBM/NEW2 domain-containing protein n=1 Tax=Actinokineospora xionganensis TaxID=2684470 RepID=A0ABR7L0H3_9PSEU|nr:endo-alpha-N-acetylgalactosaminidase family protein [Actinokineospora xionganensis]MBC6446145.1 NPCBM/NEW2 domain-containing protein [Actinokineospora xionganensis]